MAVYASNRDGGKTDEEGHYRFQNNVWSGNVIGNGVLVTENSPLGMSVLVNDGDFKVPYSDYGYTGWVDGAEEVTISTADPSNPRIDRIVLYVDRGESPQTVNPNNPNIIKFAAVAGTPSAVPVRPSDGAVDSAVGASNPWIDLADVLVGASVTQITNANITDARVPIGIAAGSKVWWEEIGRYVESNGGIDTMTVSNLPPRKFLKVYVTAINSGDISVWLRFNSDSGPNYGVQSSENFGSQATVSGDSRVVVDSISSTGSYSVIDIVNESGSDKGFKFSMVRKPNSGPNSPQGRDGKGIWNSGSLINSVSIVNGGSGSFANGSTVVVLGHD